LGTTPKMSANSRSGSSAVKYLKSFTTVMAHYILRLKSTDFAIIMDGSLGFNNICRQLTAWVNRINLNSVRPEM
ncbi:MAG: hypothetical protein KAR13_13860, partial [Desulfobulbaceae bacterium]|nr:hypothetical protein [Desulfobulbaceae bacterium]